MKNDIQTESRRSFVKHIGIAGTTLTGFSSTAMAKDDEEESSAESEGIKKKVRRLLNRGEFEKAEALLEKNGVEHAHGDLSFDASASDMATEGISPQGEWDGVFQKDESDIDFFMYNQSGDLYSVEIMFDHTPTPVNSDSNCPNDILGITFDGARWQYEEGSKNVISGDLVGFNSQPDGVTIEWDWEAWGESGQTSGHFSALVRKSDNYDGDPSNLWAHYQHNYTPAYFGGMYTGILGSKITVSPGVIGVPIITVRSWEQNTVQSF